MIKVNYRKILNSFTKKDCEQFEKLLTKLKEAIHQENLKILEAEKDIEEYETLKKAYIQAQKDLHVLIDYIGYGRGQAKVKEVITRNRDLAGTSQLKQGQVHDKVIRNIIKQYDITACNEAW